MFQLLLSLNMVDYMLDGLLALPVSLLFTAEYIFMNLCPSAYLLSMIYPCGASVECAQGVDIFLAWSSACVVHGCLLELDSYDQYA